VQLVLGHQFRVLNDDEGWHVSTVAYRYHLLDEDTRELIGWHWHPDVGAAYPHVHVPAGPIDRHVHVPTGRVSIESVLRLPLTDLQVPPGRSDFAQVLDETESKCIMHRRWHSLPMTSRDDQW
jgi:hypothetical protein